MSEPMSVVKAGLVLGAVIGGGHLCWAVLVAFGLAQSIMDFVLWMHFIKPIFVIQPFEIARAAVLVVLTAGLGFVVGSAFALIWNALHEAFRTD